MKSRLIFFLFLSVFACGAQAAPQRIVSTNLCADQLLLQLADKDQIRAVTYFSRDPALSYFIKKADGIAPVRGGIESILPLKPDLVLLGPGKMNDVIEQTLTSLKINVLRVDMPNTLKDVETQIQRVADAVGQSDRGKKLIAKMQAQMLVSKQAAKKLDYVPRIAFLYHGGYAEGRGGLVQSMLDFIGLENQIKTQQDANLSLEDLITDTPDVIVESESLSTQSTTLGELRDRHPVMQKLNPDIFLSVPPSMTICGNNVIADVGKLIVTRLGKIQPSPTEVGALQ